MPIQTGKQITTLDHAYQWCIKRHNRVFIKNKGNMRMQEHSFKVVSNMPLGSVIKMVKSGRLFECHYGDEAEQIT